MKKIFAIALLILILPHYTKAQNKSMISMQVSYNQLELGFEHIILNKKLFVELYAGIANQDINSNFDDFTSRLGLGYMALSNPKNRFSIHTDVGVYLPNNNYYSLTVPIVNTSLRYTRFVGKTKKNGLFINAGYCYGKRDYKQTYSSEIAVISTIGTFKVSPFCFSIGYGFKF